MEFEKLALGVGSGASVGGSVAKVPASASECRGPLIHMSVPAAFPIEKAIVTQHAKAAAAIAVDTAARAEAEAASQPDAPVSNRIEADAPHSDSSCQSDSPSASDAASSPFLSAAAAATAAAAVTSSVCDNFSRNNYRFALDLAPSLLLSLGPVVASIIKSGVGKKYLEFKAIRATYISCRGSLLPLPASKGEIFSSQHLSLMDKRCLMKFFKAIGPVSDAGADAGAEKRLRQLGHDLDGVSFVDLMRRHDLDDRLQEFVAFGMAGVDRLIGTSAADGITSIGAYLQSIGRYSDSSPFLYCCYGCGEMAQAYCRMAAVYGGIYVLRRSVASIHTDGAPTVEAEESNATTQTLCESSGVCLQTAPDSSSRKIKGVILTDGQCVEAAHVISSSECWPVSDHTATAVDVGSNSDVNLRAIIICSNPIPLPSDSSANTSDPGAPLLICIPPSSCPSASIITSCVRLLQLGSSCQVHVLF